MTSLISISNLQLYNELLIAFETEFILSIQMHLIEQIYGPQETNTVPVRLMKYKTLAMHTFLRFAYSSYEAINAIC